MTTREFLSRLKNVRTISGGWMAICPAHEDRRPSLSVSEGKGKILLKCQAGCETTAVVAALGLSMRDLFTEPKSNGHGRSIVAKYPYTDESGKLLFQVVRFEPKGFSQRRPDGKGGWIWNLSGVRRVLYNLPAVLKSKCVLVAEGEKDCLAASKIRFVATCNPHGAGKWRAEYSELLREKYVAIVCDADQPGLAHGRDVARSLLGVADTVWLIEALPKSKDLAEWVEHGGTHDALVEILKKSLKVTPADVEKWQTGKGSDALDAAFEYITRFVSLSEAQARIVALWVAHTHCFEAADCTPYLSINSAEKQSGKTRLLEVLELLVAKPWLTGRASPAVLMRKIEAEGPTLLLDESDTAFGAEKEYAEALRGALNSGYRRGGVASCCVGQGSKITFADFSTFCPKAIAGIGKLPDTVADRSIPIRLKRAQRGKVERFRKRDAEAGASKISAKFSAWGAENIKKLGQARPEIPSQLSDRQADVSEPLLAIADLASGDWPQAARRAIAELCAKAQDNDESTGVKLLADIKRVFHPRGDEGDSLMPLDRISSCDLVKALSEMEDRPWAEWGKSRRPMTPPQLARQLARYEIAPKTMRLPDGQRLKGYEREWFEETWALYLPPDLPFSSHTPLSNRDTVTTRENTEGNGGFQSVTASSCHASENAVSASKNAPCHGVTVQKPGEQELGGENGNLHGQQVAGNHPNSSPESRPGAMDGEVTVR